ncbi:Exoglucanase 1 [Ceratobasidium sp. 428]|nr:Exoglucanase 1 [Ceratobasidium sp. 428]
MGSIVLLFPLLFGLVHGQLAGTLVAETHPLIPWQKCTKAGGCITQSGKIVLDANWRWLHNNGGYTNCHTANAWDSALCPDPLTCSRNCAFEGADYSGTYGITAKGNALTLKFVTPSSSVANVGSRVYLLASDTTYQMFKLKNQEFTFDVDLSNVPCGVNGALSFTGMAADGGMSTYPNNKAGAKYGTGYCDATCPKNQLFINGEANILDWTPSNTNPNAGTGRYGSCCGEIDVLEANKASTAYIAHPCTVQSQTRCSGSDCTSGLCDSVGCDFNPYRLGNKTFYGPGMTVNTSQKFTVTTQFITSDGTATGALSEIRRIYVQNGKVIQNSNTSIPGMASYNSITDSFCAAEKTAFGEPNTFSDKGGLTSLGKAVDRGMVLTMSILDDHDSRMLWLDSNFPIGADPSKPGVIRGTCSTGSGVPADVEVIGTTSSVTFSNLKFGDIGSTSNSVPV